MTVTLTVLTLLKINLFKTICEMGLPRWLGWKRILLQCKRPGFDPWVRKIHWRRYKLPTQSSWASFVAQLVKNPPRFNPWVGKIPWRWERLPTPVFWPGEFHELYRPWGHKNYLWDTGSVIKESAFNAGDHLQCKRPGFDPWVGKIPWRRKWQPIPVFLPEEPRGQRNWAGHSP